MIRMTTEDQRPSFPEFDLYGNQQGNVGAGFLHIEDIAHRSAAHDFVIRPHVHRDLYQFILVERGLKKSTQDEACYQELEHALIFTPPGVVHSFEVDRNPSGYVVTCSENIVASFMAEGRETRPFDALGGGHVTFLASGSIDWATVWNLMKLAYREQQGNACLKYELMHAATTIVLIAAMRRALERSLTSPSLAPNPVIFNKLFVEIERRFRTEHRVDAYAEILGVSTVKLNRVCKAYKARSVKQLILERVIREAKRLLIYTQNPVSELAYELGFQDHAYFSRVFKAHTGLAPKEFREASQNTAKS